MADAQLSPEDEERLVREFFDGDANGFFVEVGVRHPTEGSRSWHLEQAGWTGVLVEARPDIAAFLVTVRKAKVFAAACTSADDAGPAKAMQVESLGARVDHEPTTRAPDDYTVVAPTRTLDSILKEADAPVPVDLLAVDIERQGVGALEGLDFAHWQPLLILANDAVGNLRAHRLLKRKDYRLVRRLGLTSWYVPTDMAMRLTGKQRREILWEYYLALPFRKLRNLSRHVRGK